MGCGSRRAPPQTCPKESAMAWAEQWLQEGVEVNWEKLLPPKGFVVLPRRWVAEHFLPGSATTEG